MEGVRVIGRMDEKVVNGSLVPVGHAVIAQPWKVSPYLVLVDPHDLVEECLATTSRSVELVLHDLCDVGKFKSPRVKVDKQNLFSSTPGGPWSFVIRHA